MLKRHRRHCRPPEVEAAPFVGSGQNTESCVVWLTLQQQQAKHKVAQKSSLRSREVFLSQKQTALNFHFSDKSISHIVCVWWCKADKYWDGAKVHQQQKQQPILTLYLVCTAPTRPPNRWLAPGNVQISCWTPLTKVDTMLLSELKMKLPKSAKMWAGADGDISGLVQNCQFFSRQRNVRLTFTVVPKLSKIHKPKFALLFHGKPKQEQLINLSDQKHQFDFLQTPLVACFKT